MQFEDSPEFLLKLSQDIHSRLPKRNPFQAEQNWLEGVSQVLEGMGIRLSLPELKKLWQDAVCSWKLHCGGYHPVTPPETALWHYAVFIATAWLNKQGKPIRVLF